MTELPRALLESLENAGLTASVFGRDAKANLPDGKGSYLLLLHLPTGLTMKGGRFAGTSLPAGWVLYAGSARGPGGLKARVSRHLRLDKSKRWHVDWITAAAHDVFAMCFMGCGECDIVAALSGCGAFDFPVPGLGSSDCRTCVSHVLCWRGC